MIETMSKEDALKDFIEKNFQERWAQELFNINDRYNKDKEKLDNELVSTFEKLCKEATSLQEKGLKGGIKYIYISFLRTSIMDNTSFYRMDAYDDKWFLDKEECCTLWDADFIFSSLFEHMSELEGKKTEYGRKITLMDIDRLKLFEALKYHILAIEFIREMVPRFLQTDAYKQMNKAGDIRILAGEYMDQSEILYKEEED